MGQICSNKTNKEATLKSSKQPSEQNAQQELGLVDKEKQPKEKQHSGMKHGQLGLLDIYQVGRQIGKGATSKIHLGYDNVQKRKVALKILESSKFLDKNFKAEWSALQNLNHANVIRLHKASAKGKFTDERGQVSEKTFMALEYASGGNLFDYVAQTGAFPEEVCRYYFHQIIDGLEHIHSNGFAHRDLKPANILLNKEFKIKIADFGFAKFVDEDRKKMITYCGTVPYMSPELLRQDDYVGEEVDIFAAGVNLFVIYSGQPPFTQASMKDAHYRYLIKKTNQYWGSITRNKRKGFFSDDFKDLIGKMFKYKPKDRLTIAQIKEHAWYNGKVADNKTVIAQFKKRQNEIKEKREKQKQAKIQMLKDKKDNIAYNGVNNFRDVPIELVKQFDMGYIQKNLDKQFDKWNKEHRQIFDFEEEGELLQNIHYMRVDETDILEFLLAVLQTDKSLVEIKLDDEQFKITCEYKQHEGLIQEEEIICKHKLSITIHQLKDQKDIKVLEFVNELGGQNLFHLKFKEIQTQFLEPLVEAYQRQQ